MTSASERLLLRVLLAIKRTFLDRSGILCETSGSVAITLSLSLAGLTAVTALAVDYTNYQREQAALQGIADTAALSGARTLTIAKDSAEVRAVISNTAAAASGTASNDIKISESIDAQAGLVRVTITKLWKPFLARLVVQGERVILAQAEARLTGGSRLCVLGLNETADATIALSGDSQIAANGCAVISNSTSPTAIGSYKNSLIKAKMICSSGGVSGGTANFSPQPTLDCPRITDPLRSRAPPPMFGCDYTNYSISGIEKVLSPGIYCGGLLIANGANVTFEPGTYVIKDGPFSVTHTSRVSGKYVGFFLTGSHTNFTFAAGTQIELHAPRTGPLAGLLFYEDPNVPNTEIHNIVSDNARVLVGTIYLPKGIFRVSSQKPVADLSAYTAIIANKIELNRYPSIVLNSNYDQTDVPVPGNFDTGIGKSVQLKN